MKEMKEKGEKKHEKMDSDQQPKGYGSEHTPGIKMGEYKRGEHFHDCSRED